MDRYVYMDFHHSQLQSLTLIPSPFSFHFCQLTLIFNFWGLIFGLTFLKSGWRTIWGSCCCCCWTPPRPGGMVVANWPSCSLLGLAAGWSAFGGMSRPWSYHKKRERNLIFRLGIEISGLIPKLKLNLLKFNIDWSFIDCDFIEIGGREYLFEDMYNLGDYGWQNFKVCNSWRVVFTRV